MKKALTLLAVAAMAAVSFVGCSKTYDVDATLETGTENYDFNGKTLVATSTDYITKTVTVRTNATGFETKTVTLIPATETTETLVFAEDGTLTDTTKTVYLAGVDNDYRNLSVTSTDFKITTTTTFSNVDNVFGDSDGVFTGFAGQTKSTSTGNGKWTSYSVQDSAIDGQTQLYHMVPVSKTKTDTDDSTLSADATAVTGSASVDKYTYKAGTTNTSSEQFNTTDIKDIGYSLKGTKVDSTGAEKTWIWVGAGTAWNKTWNVFSNDFLVQ